MAKRYWLFKSEPGCFSIDHLAACPGQRSSWDGVRNYQARNLLRDDVKQGDQMLFYYSSAKPLGIAGVCDIVASGYPDHTAWDPDNEHFDPKASADNPIWYMVDVKLQRKFDPFLTLEELKSVAGLEKMMLLQRGSRLSIQPVRPEEWKIIEKLTTPSAKRPAAR